MSKKFSELRGKMSKRSQARADAKSKILLKVLSGQKPRTRVSTKPNAALRRAARRHAELVVQTVVPSMTAQYLDDLRLGALRNVLGSPFIHRPVIQLCAKQHAEFRLNTKLRVLLRRVEVTINKAVITYADRVQLIAMLSDKDVMKFMHKLGGL